MQQNQPQQQPNSSIRQKRQNQHKQIRRQYIQKFIKTRRKQLFSVQPNSSSSLYKTTYQSNQLRIQTQYNQYLQSSCSHRIFQQSPNLHLQMFVEILNYQNSHLYKKYYGTMLLIINEYLMRRLNEENYNMELFCQFLQRQQQFSNELQLFSDTVRKIIVYDQVLFEPYMNGNMSSTGVNESGNIQFRNHQFKQAMQPYTYPSSSYTSHRQINEQIKSTNNERKQKINIMLLLDFFIGITYDITPDSFIQSYSKQQIESFKQGYEYLTQEQQNNNTFSHINQQNNRINSNQSNNNNNQDNDIQFKDTSKDYQRGLNQFISILDNIYNFSYSLIQIFSLVRYQTSSLQQISTFLYKLYNNHSSQQQQYNSYRQYNRSQLPLININPQQMFAKQSIKQKISSRAYQIIINYSSFTDLNHQIDISIHKKRILNDLQYITQECGCNSLTDIKAITEIYANLIPGDIKYNQQGFNHYQQEQEMSQDEHNQRLFRDPPGVYLNLLQLITQNALQCQVINLLTYILVTILQKYIIPNPQENQSSTTTTTTNRLNKNNKNQQSEPISNKLQLSQVYCQSLQSLVSQTMHNISKAQGMEIQYLSNLFILVCTKLYPYLNYHHLLQSVLQLVIRNQNVRMSELDDKIKAKRISNKANLLNINSLHSSNNQNIFNNINNQNNQNHFNNTNTQSNHQMNLFYTKPNPIQTNNFPQSQQVQRRIVKQNIKRVIHQCGNLLIKQAKSIKNHGSEIGFKLANLQYINQANTLQFINKIIYFWKQNELQYCYEQFVRFIYIAVKYFPEKVILVNEKSQQQQQNQGFIEILEDIASTEKYDNTFVNILRYTYDYLCDQYEKPGQQLKDKIMSQFQSHHQSWQHILQYLEGLIYSEKTSSNHQNSTINQDTHHNNQYQKSNSNQDYEIGYPQTSQNNTLQLIQELYDCFDKMINHSIKKMEIQ